jgi:hypothetical protein
VAPHATGKVRGSGVIEVIDFGRFVKALLYHILKSAF